MSGQPRHHPAQSENNWRVWKLDDNVADYAHRQLRPVEVLLLARYSEQLRGRVLDVGCGAGRILGYLVGIGGEVYGIDLSERMVAYCQGQFPAATVRLGDLRELAEAVDGRFDAILVFDNTVDVIDDAERRAFFADARGLLAPGGLLLFSSHNLAAVTTAPGLPAGKRLRRWLHESPAGLFSRVLRFPGRVRNRRRLRPLEYRTDDHAVLNDEERNYGALHYYINRDDQERQLHDAGFELVECLDVDGRAVDRGVDPPDPWLHYVARPAV